MNETGRHTLVLCWTDSGTRGCRRWDISCGVGAIFERCAVVKASCRCCAASVDVVEVVPGERAGGLATQWDKAWQRNQ